MTTLNGGIMENFGWRRCKEMSGNKVLIVSRTKAVLGMVFAVIIIFAFGLSIGILMDKELFKEIYKDVGREEAIKEFSDLLEKIPGEKGSANVPMLIPSPDKEVIRDIEQGEKGAKI